MNEQHTSPISDAISEMEVIQRELSGMGLSIEQVQQLQELLSRYGETREEIMKQRSTQFSKDSHAILMKIKAYSNRNHDQVNAFLRRFAEHIAANTLELAKASKGKQKVEDIVDRIVPLSPQEDE
jgi:N12 class adenine-specific DNA methylase